MKKLLMIAFVGLFSTQAQCGTWFNSQIQGSGRAATKYIPTQGIRHASLSTVGNLHIEQCKDPLNCVEELTMTADDNILDLFEAVQYKDQLNLTTKKNASFSTKTPITYRLTVKDINSMSNSGPGNITSSPITTDALSISKSGPGSIISAPITAKTLTINASGPGNITSAPITTDIISIHASGAGDVTMKSIQAKKLNLEKSGTSSLNACIHTNELNVDGSEVGSVTLKGTTKQQVVEWSGTGTYNAKELESDCASFSASGIGNIHLNVKEKIQGKMSGIGSGTYNGKHNPEVTVRTTGIGKFRKV